MNEQEKALLLVSTLLLTETLDAYFELLAEIMPEHAPSLIRTLAEDIRRKASNLEVNQIIERAADDEDRLSQLIADEEE